jgi:hypothetical protein
MLEGQLFIFKLIADSGLLVLIWLVQLVIYPSFKYYSVENLHKWHSVYTSKITIVVLPLMLAQLVLSIWLAFENKFLIFNIIDLTLVLTTWISTFVTFVPLHQKIDSAQHKDNAVYISKLVTKNWLRTIIWTALFFLTLYKCFF